MSAALGATRSRNHSLFRGCIPPNSSWNFVNRGLQTDFFPHLALKMPSSQPGSLRAGPVQVMFEDTENRRPPQRRGSVQWSPECLAGTSALDREDGLLKAFFRTVLLIRREFEAESPSSVPRSPALLRMASVPATAETPAAAPHIHKKPLTVRPGRHISGPYSCAPFPRTCGTNGNLVSQKFFCRF